MKRGQTSIEYLLLTAGVILTAVVTGHYIATSGAHVQHATSVEANALMTIHDTIPPTTTLMCNGTSCFTKYNHDVKISFVCQDNLQGTGCKETHYKINGGAWQTCSQPSGCKDKVTLNKPASGSTTYSIEFYSVDMNGNVENKKMVTITIGGSFSATGACAISYMPQYPKPGDSVQIDAKTSTQLKGVEITVKKGSTVVATKNCGDMGSGQTCSLAFSPSSEGAYNVNVTGKDAFGNSGTCGTTTVNVDGTAPAITFNSPDACAWYKEDFTVDVDASDGPNPGSSLMNQWKYDVWDSKGSYTSGEQSIGATQNTSKSFDIKVGPSAWCSEQGPKKCNVQVSFTDRAGNTGSAKKQYSIDYTKPKTSVDLPAAGWVNHPINVTIHCNDEPTTPNRGAGCKKIYWKLVSPGSSCPLAGDSSWNEKNYTPKTGSCPYLWELSESKTIQINCSGVCTYDLCYYAEDGAGNTSAVEKTTLHANNGNEADGSYAIDTISPSCTITLKSKPDTSKNGWTNGSYTYSVSCNDGTGQSGLRSVSIELQNPGCGGCQLSCDGGNSITFASAKDSYTTTCTVSAKKGSVCTADGLKVEANDFAGNTGSASISETMKIDLKNPTKPGAAWDINPGGAVPSSPVCESYCYGSWGGWYKTVYFTIDSEDSGACNSHIAAIALTLQDGLLVGGNPKAGVSPHYWANINGVEYGMDSINYTTAETRTWGISISSTDKFEGVMQYNGTKIWAVDDAGNSGPKQDIYGWCIDNKPPQIASKSISKGKICSNTNTGAPLTTTITATVTDNGSGIKTIVISAGSASKTWNYSCGHNKETVSVSWGYTDIKQTGSVPVKITVSDQLGNTKTYDIGSVYVASACTDSGCYSYQGATYAGHCNDIKAGTPPSNNSTHCGDSSYNGWEQTGSSSGYYCSSGDVYQSTTYDYKGYTGECKLDATGNPYCATTTTSCTNSKLVQQCTGDLICDAKNGGCRCPTGESLCGTDKCYDSDSEVCCNGNVYSGNCCSDADCSDDYYYCNGNDVWYKDFKCSNHKCTVSSQYVKSCDNGCGTSCGDDFSCSGNCNPGGTDCTCTVTHHTCSCQNGSCTCVETGTDSCSTVLCKTPGP